MTKMRNFFDEDTHLSEESLALYVDALKLNKVYLLPGVILGHVSDCEKCKSEIVEILSFVDHGSYSEVEPHPFLGKMAKPTSAKFSLFYRIAAVFFIGISISILFYLFRSTKDNGSALTDSAISVAHQESKKGTLKRDELANQQNIFADNFFESPNLENLVNSVSRSESPIVVSPKNNAVESQNIIFEWKLQEAGWVSVTLLSNKEDVLRNIRLKHSKFFFSEKLNPGLYYWKLEREGELLYVGKFFVK
jgi:hypothetical protein